MNWAKVLADEGAQKASEAKSIEPEPPKPPQAKPKQRAADQQTAEAAQQAASEREWPSLDSEKPQQAAEGPPLSPREQAGQQQQRDAQPRQRAESGPGLSATQAAQADSSSPAAQPRHDQSRPAPAPPARWCPAPCLHPAMHTLIADACTVMLRQAASCSAGVRWRALPYLADCCADAITEVAALMQATDESCVCGSQLAERPEAAAGS